MIRDNAVDFIRAFYDLKFAKDVVEIKGFNFQWPTVYINS